MLLVSAAPPLTSESMRFSVASLAAFCPYHAAPSGISHAVGASLSLLKPHCVTMRRAMLRTCWRSFDAPVVISSAPKTSSSATRPPNATASCASK